MARMASKNRVAFDAAAQVKLRDATAGAVTVSTNEAPIALDILTSAYWDAGEQSQGVFTIALDVTAIKTAAANETYLIQVEVDTTAAMLAPVEVVRYNVSAAVANQAKPGFLELGVAASLIEYMKAGAKFIRIKSTLGGTAPSIVYGARMTYQDN
jgi:hypothetical protein